VHEPHPIGSSKYDKIRRIAISIVIGWNGHYCFALNEHDAESWINVLILLHHNMIFWWPQIKSPKCHVRLQSKSAPSQEILKNRTGATNFLTIDTSTIFNNNEIQTFGIAENRTIWLGLVLLYVVSINRCYFNLATIQKSSS
jgi:hypothetical protein